MVLLLVVSMLAFGAMNLLGDPLFNILGPTAGDVDNPESLAKIEAVKEEYNLDDPLPVRYALWLGAFVQGDFGVQFSEDGQPPVRDLIVERIPRPCRCWSWPRPWRCVMVDPVGALLRRRGRTRRPTRCRRSARSGSSPSRTYALAIHHLVPPRDQVRLLPARVRGGRSAALTVPPTVLPAFALALPAAAVYQRLLRTDLITHAAGGLHPDGAGQGSVAPIGALQTRTAALAVLVRHRVRAHHRRAHRRSAHHREHLPHPRSRSGAVEAVLREDFPVVLAIVMIGVRRTSSSTSSSNSCTRLIDPRVRR